MKIIVAQTAGFCFGVKRVVDLALDHASTHPEGILTLGPVIHNAQTISMLHERGARVLKKESTPPPGSPLLVRAHGIPPEVEEHYQKLGHQIIDGTCPKVKTVHRVISKYRSQDYAIVITGDEGHAEVVALQGYAGEQGYLICCEADVQKLPPFKRVCLVSQTTFDKEIFERIAGQIQSRYPEAEVVIKKTICAATHHRQEETATLAHKVDAMIVVGGKNSANTCRLATLAQEAGTPTQHVESEQEIDFKKIQNCATIGITAGASTPTWMINRVVDYLHYMADYQRNSVAGFARRVVGWMADLNIFVATGAAAMYFVSTQLQSLSFHASGAVLSFLYILSMYLWNSLSSIEMTQHHGLARHRFYNNHKRVLFALSGLCSITVLGISWMLSSSLFYLMLFATAAGTAYHLSIVPAPLRRIIPYKTLRDIPTSRDLFVSLAWATLLTAIPQVLNNQPLVGLPTILCFGWIFFLAYLRAVTFDLRDIEGDRIMGRETLVIIVGEKKIRSAILMLLRISLGVLVIYPVVMILLQHNFTTTGVAFITQIPVLAYLFMFTKKSSTKSVANTPLFNIFADTQFYLSGVLAWLSTLWG